MKTFTLRYPGDPPCQVVLLTRQEFLARFPDRSVTLSDGTGKVLYHENIGDKIVCDLCCADPHDTIYVLGSSRAYCQDCFNSSLARYCKENK